MLAYKHLEGNLCFYYTILWILFAFLILVLLNLCMSSVSPYLQTHKRQRDKQYAQNNKVKDRQRCHSQIKSQHSNFSDTWTEHNVSFILSKLILVIKTSVNPQLYGLIIKDHLTTIFHSFI